MEAGGRGQEQEMSGEGRKPWTRAEDVRGSTETMERAGDVL